MPRLADTPLCAAALDAVAAPSPAAAGLIAAGAARHVAVADRRRRTKVSDAYSVFGLRAKAWVACAGRAVPPGALAVRAAAFPTTGPTASNRASHKHGRACRRGEVFADTRAVFLGCDCCVVVLQLDFEFERHVPVLAPHAIDEIAALEADDAIRTFRDAKGGLISFKRQA